MKNIDASHLYILLASSIFTIVMLLVKLDREQKAYIEAEKKAIQWQKKINKLRQEAQSGDVKAMLALAQTSTIWISEEGGKWLKKAAQKEHIQGMYFYARWLESVAIYTKGNTKKKCEQEAMVWYKKAAQKDHIRARVSYRRLAKIYQKSESQN